MGASTWSERMRVIHVAMDVLKRCGGLAVSARGLTAALARQGADVEVLSVEPGRQGVIEAPGQGRRERPSLRTFAPGFPRRWGRSPELLSHLRAAAETVDVIHFHGLWRHPVTAGSRLARELGIPYVVTLHGLLCPLALAHHGWGKRPYLAVLERQTLEGAAALHCLSESELMSVKRHGLDGKAVVLPNGVSPEDLARPRWPSRLKERHGALRDKRVLLYLARLIPEKGVRLLIPALKQVCQAFPDAHLVLAGRARPGEATRLKMLATWHGVRDRMTYLGLLSREEAWDALAGAEVLVHPSLEEADSITVLEALTVGLPLILGPGPDNPSLRERGVGWPVAPDPASIASAIQEVLGSPEKARRNGEAGRDWVRSERSWDRIAARWVEVYGALSRRRTAPITAPAAR